MSTTSKKSFGQRIIELSELPKRKYFFWTAFVPIFPTFVLFYLISPVLQTKIVDFQYDLIAVLLSSALAVSMITFFVSASLDYMKYSSKVYGAVTSKTHVVLAKNRFIRDILELFTDSVATKLNEVWNRRGETIDQHTEQLAGQEYAIKTIKEDITEIRYQQVTSGDYNIIIARLTRTIYDLNLRLREIESQLKEKESDKDQEIKILREKLEQVTNELLKALEELRRFKGE